MCALSANSSSVLCWCIRTSGSVLLLVVVQLPNTYNRKHCLFGTHSITNSIHQHRAVCLIACCIVHFTSLCYWTLYYWILQFAYALHCRHWLSRYICSLYAITLYFMAACCDCTIVGTGCGSCGSITLLNSLSEFRPVLMQCKLNCRL